MASVVSASPTGPVKRRKLPACDPCRSSKMACDHGQPVCARCTERDRADSCTYRTRPFKKKRGHCSYVEPALSQPDPDHGPHVPRNAPQPNISSILVRPRTYPDPGYLGHSSHTTVFGHLSLEQGGLRNVVGRQRIDRPGQQINEAQVARGADLIEQLYRFPHLHSCFKLVKTRLGTGANLALAASFTEQCTLTAERLLSPSSDRFDAAEISASLFKSSCRPLEVVTSTTSEAFCSQFNGGAARWETLALFCISVSRALLACRSWAMPPFDTQNERCRVQTLFMHFADSCVDICLSLDCLNDLHLVLQYENYIIHSLIDGDQSLVTWRRLGDLISCLLALGYHEEMDSTNSLPGFVTSL
ncbi:hypothetical protein CCHR01_01346 [Colletotrichum chrysophilum]|uniref:Zn(2)-C6 fungal-type domain-containing protein n=1 Tax=Colletotrichum chrysophilum TaxID=1836956 RepID=A0AAD9B241_9PEZI|nr:hypothetical protein CCHR01_01346 [Colletotrichum chrysophilum]